MIFDTGDGGISLSDLEDAELVWEDNDGNEHRVPLSDGDDE
jgi:hypothetical protein